MSLTTVVATLFLAGILNQSSAFRLTAPKGTQPEFEIKNFSWQNDTTGAYLNATLPAITGSDFLTRTSEWRQYSGDGYKTITLTFGLSMNLTYYQTKTGLGPFSDKGVFRAATDNQQFNLTLIATGPSDKCYLSLQARAIDLNVEPDFSDLGNTGAYLAKIPSIYNDIKTKLAKSLVIPLNFQLSETVEIFFKCKKVDFTALCTEVQNSDSANFPTPLMCEH